MERKPPDNLVPFPSPDTGRKGYREDWEPVDDRPAIAWDSCRCRACRERVGIWKDDVERQTYEAAVSCNPRQPDEGPMAYARRISRLVTEEYQPEVPVRRMPKAGRVRI